MNLRWLRPLFYVFLTVQVLLAAPLAAAMPSGDMAGEPKCAGTMAHSMDPDTSACCPDGHDSIASCLSACQASAAAIPTFNVVFSKEPAASVPQVPPARVVLLADPPIKPPPIV